MTRPERSPDLIKAQREKVRLAIAEIMAERGFVNVYQLLRWLKNQGHTFGSKTLSNYAMGTSIPSSDKLFVLWTEFQNDRLNPATFGPTWDYHVRSEDDARGGTPPPELPTDLPLLQKAMVCVVVHDFCLKEGVTTSNQLRTRFGFSGSTSQALFAGTIMPAPATLAKLRGLTNDPRLANEVYHSVERLTVALEEAQQCERRVSTVLRGVVREQKATGTQLKHIVTTDQFPPIEEPEAPNATQLEDTRRMLEELRRRLLLCSMIRSDRKREAIRHVLGQELDAFYLVLRLFEAENPTGIARILAEQQDSFLR